MGDFLGLVRFQQMADEMLTSTQVAKMCGVTRARVSQWVKEKKLPGVKAGDRLLFRREDVEAFIIKRAKHRAGIKDKKKSEE